MKSTSDFRAILAVTHKELLGSIRDRQTAIYTLVLPICLYPIVFWIMIQGFLLVQGQKERTPVEVGLAAMRPEALAEGIHKALTRREPGEPLQSANVVRLESLPGPLDAEGARAWIEGGDRDPLSPEEAEEGRPDAVLFLPTPSDGDEERAQLYYYSTQSRSEIARERIAGRLPTFVAGLRSAAAREAGQDPQELEPVTVRRTNFAPRRDEGAVMLSVILPLLMVVMAVMGAFFPAVDLTAGEKERGTAETTMLLPVPRAAVHQGKILAVCTTAVLATFLNLLALGLSAEHLLAMLSASADVTIELPLLALLAVMPLALLFAFFVSAVLTGFAGLAASFKEGQALLGPVQMIFILPAMVGVIPGIKLSLGWAFVPVVNVVLAFRAMLIAEPLYLEYAVTAGALLLYAWIAIRVAVRLLSRESVTMAGSTIPIRRLLTTLRGTGGTD